MYSKCAIGITWKNKEKKAFLLIRANTLLLSKPLSEPLLSLVVSFEQIILLSPEIQLLNLDMH